MAFSDDGEEPGLAWGKGAGGLRGVGAQRIDGVHPILGHFGCRIDEVGEWLHVDAAHAHEHEKREAEGCREANAPYENLDHHLSTSAFGYAPLLCQAGDIGRVHGAPIIEDQAVAAAALRTDLGHAPAA